MTLRKNILIKHDAVPNAMRVWMTSATPKERKRLASLAKTTLGNLQQLAGAYRTEGRANLDSDLARRVEIATEKMQREGLPVLARESLSPACSRCEFAKQCRAG